MYYKEASEYFDQILDEEGIKLTERFKKNLLSIMSEMCGYSEEDHKIRPQVILSENIESFIMSIPSKSYLIMFRDTLDGDKLARFFKSLALFCDNGWYIVININGSAVEYGIFRKYSGIDGDRFEDFFKSEYYSESGHMIILNTISNFEIAIVRYGKKDCIISQKFIKTDDDKDNNEDFKELANDIVRTCKAGSRDYIRNCFLKLFWNLPLRIHGTIMLVVEDDFKLPEDTLSGIRIEPAIDFESLFETNNRIESYEESENVYSLVGALYEMLNTDGITIITNKARLLYYNVFYEGIIPKNIKGGARKRTALGICQNNNLEGVIGVYFQSQDGAIFYRRKGV